MIGEEINEVERPGDTPLENEPRSRGGVTPPLQLSNLTVLGSRNEIAVSDVSMATHRGEIVGIAGVDGNGQRELAEAIMGLRHSESGTISILGTDPKGTKAVRQSGVGYIPEDRQTTGVIASFSVMENLLLNVTHLERTRHTGMFLIKKENGIQQNNLSLIMTSVPLSVAFPPLHSPAATNKKLFSPEKSRFTPTYLLPLIRHAV